MSNVLRRVGRSFMVVCTVVVVLAGLTYVVGQVVGVPVRVTYQTVASALLPGEQVPAPALLPPGYEDRSVPDSSASAFPAETAGARAGVEGNRVQNVIFFVGDGMGLSMISTVDALAERRLAMTQMPVTGFVRVASLSSLITDSAAGATAFATGYKTINGAVAMAPGEEGGASGLGEVADRGTLVARPTILEAAARQGFATGVVTTSYLTDATPAAFTAHAPSRDDYGTIARQMIASEADVLIGGDQAIFTDSLRQEARQQGFVVADELEALREAPPAARWLGLFPDREGSFLNMSGPPLVETLEAVLRRLRRQERRFFLVVEQEGTDAAGHANRLPDARRYLRELDRAVAHALRFASQDGHTLVVVTADHDTGGLDITEGRYEEGRITARWNSFGHTAKWTPLLAYGPGAWHFAGVQENTSLPVTMKRLLGLEGFLDAKALAEAEMPAGAGR